ncbi:hypothetical protein GOODEAATRI_034676, partial [Goodea atripinnis]
NHTWFCSAGNKEDGGNRNGLIVDLVLLLFLFCCALKAEIFIIQPNPPPLSEAEGENMTGP